MQYLPIPQVKVSIFLCSFGIVYIKRNCKIYMRGTYSYIHSFLNKLAYRNVEFLTGLAGFENRQEIGTPTRDPLNLEDGRISKNLIMGRLYVDGDSVTTHRHRFVNWSYGRQFLMRHK